MNIRFSASLMCADFFNLSEQFEELKGVGINVIHYDVMDGHFVPNIMLGFEIARTLIEKSGMEFEVHLMVEEPWKYIKECYDVGFSTVIIHVESAQSSIFRTLDDIAFFGMKKGIACSPITPVFSFKSALPYVDRVTLLAVDPGFAGQRFIPQVLEKVDELDMIRRSEEYDFEIEIDGSVNLRTIPEIVKHPVDRLVLGSSGLFGNPRGIKAAYNEIINALKRAKFNEEVHK